MGLPTNIASSHLHDMRLRLLRGLAIPTDDVEAMIEVLDALLDEAHDADEPHDNIGDLVGVIPKLEKLRAEAVEQKDDIEHEKDEEIANVEKERDDAAAEHAQAIADLKEEHEQELAKLREEYEAEFARLRARVTETNAAKVMVGAKLVELKSINPWKLLADLVAASTNYDAMVIGILDYPNAKIVQTRFRRERDRALEALQGLPKPVAANEDIPTRSARRRARK